MRVVMGHVGGRLTPVGRGATVRTSPSAVILGGHTERVRGAGRDCQPLNTAPTPTTYLPPTATNRLPRCKLRPALPHLATTTHLPPTATNRPRRQLRPALPHLAPTTHLPSTATTPLPPSSAPPRVTVPRCGVNHPTLTWWFCELKFLLQ